MRGRALRLLARREHARRELEAKLAARGARPSELEAVLEALEQEGLLSDRRFAEQHAGARIERGYGPRRILAELRVRGVEDALARAVLDEMAPDWVALADAARARRFGTERPGAPQDRVRQMRFLDYRGFTHEQIRAAWAGEGRDRGTR